MKTLIKDLTKWCRSTATLLMLLSSLSYLSFLLNVSTDQQTFDLVSIRINVGLTFFILIDFNFWQMLLIFVVDNVRATSISLAFFLLTTRTRSKLVFCVSAEQQQRLCSTKKMWSASLFFLFSNMMMIKEVALVRQIINQCMSCTLLSFRKNKLFYQVKVTTNDICYVLYLLY